MSDMSISDITRRDHWLSVLYYLPILTTGMMLIGCYLLIKEVDWTNTPWFFSAFLGGFALWSISGHFQQVAQDERCKRRFRQRCGLPPTEEAA